MKRKKKRRYSLETLVLSQLVPPLGFFRLWTIARTRRTKGIVLVCFVLVMALATVVIFKTGVYSRFKKPEAPVEGYDITHDERGNYRTQEILPFERTIFHEVVVEMRRIQPQFTIPNADLFTIEMVQPEYQAFVIVATRHGMDQDEVKGIYLKVTTLSPLAKGKK